MLRMRRMLRAVLTWTEAQKHLHASHCAVDFFELAQPAARGNPAPKKKTEKIRNPSGTTNKHWCLLAGLVLLWQSDSGTPGLDNLRQVRRDGRRAHADQRGQQRPARGHKHVAQVLLLRNWMEKK